MTNEHVFPSEAFGGKPQPQEPPAAPVADVSDGPAAASGGEASAVEAVAATKALKAKLWPAAGVAIGIGSAAVAAALLYRGRR